MAIKVRKGQIRVHFIGHPHKMRVSCKRYAFKNEMIYAAFFCYVWISGPLSSVRNGKAGIGIRYEISFGVEAVRIHFADAAYGK